MPFLLNKFAKKFVVYILSFFINFFLGYIQVESYKKFWDMRDFITFYNLIKMTKWFKKAINSLTQFVKTTNKIVLNQMLY